MANTIKTWIARIALSGGLLALLWWLGRVPAGAPAEQAVLRLAWRMSGAQVRVCKDRTEEELMRLLPHMRQKQVCVDHAVPYRLTLRVNGETRLDREVFPRGARGDRPIFVQDDLPLEAGSHRVQLDFAPLVPPAPEDMDDREEDDRSEMVEELREAIEATPRHALDRTLRTATGRITLIELGESDGAWRVYEP